MHKLQEIQYLRGLAALLVVLSHVSKEILNIVGSEFSDPLNLKLSGQFGVDLFFVISGFIMFYVSRTHNNTLKDSWVFIQKRFVRIVPLYWALTVVTIIISFMFSSYKNNNDIDVFYVVASFLFYPAERLSDGNVTPVFGLGWTLNYEMLFYLLFSIVLVLPREKILHFVAGIFSALVIVGVFVEKSDVSIWYWTRPIIFEFALGVFIAHLYIVKYRVSSFAGSCLLVFGVSFWLVSSSLVEASKPELRLWLWGLPAALITAGVVLSDKTIFDFMPKALLRAGGGIGNASFSLYLGHMFVIRGLSIFFVPEYFGVFFPFIFFVTSILGAFLFAEITYRLIELPSNKYGLKLLGLDSQRFKSAVQVNSHTR